MREGWPNPTLLSFFFWEIGQHCTWRKLRKPATLEVVVAQTSDLNILLHKLVNLELTVWHEL
jgi:hypothetical protein